MFLSEILACDDRESKMPSIAYLRSHLQYLIFSKNYGVKLQNEWL